MTENPEMKKVLIISYYFPPSGGAGVQRVLKLIKYLREFGWEPVVYTAKDAAYPIFDKTLQKDIPEGIKIYRHKIREPYELYKKLTGQKKEEPVYSGFISENKKISFAQKFAIWIRGNFFIPDARRFWIKPSVKFLINELKKNPVDAMISSGPPHTTHMIALGVKRKLNIPWLADFRDPWTNIDFYDQLMLTRWADARHKLMEKQVLTQADAIDTVSWHWAEDFEKLSGRKVDVVTNGFDEDDFGPPTPLSPKGEELSRGDLSRPAREGERRIESEGGMKFIIAHIGSLNKDRNHPALWEALRELCDEQKDFREKLLIQLIGKNDFSVYHDIEKNGLSNHLQRIDYLPHSEVGSYQQRASVLYLPLNNTPNVAGIVPGKLFEYLAAQRPILIVGVEDGDSARIVREANAGVMCSFNDKSKIKNEISKMFSLWKQGNLKVDAKGVEQYSRRKVAGKIAALLNRIAK